MGIFDNILKSTQSNPNPMSNLMGGKQMGSTDVTHSTRSDFGGNEDMKIEELMRLLGRGSVSPANTYQTQDYGSLVNLIASILGGKQNA